MSIYKILFFCGIVLCSACSSDIFLDHNGNIPSPDKISQLKKGQSKNEVIRLLGAPSAITGLNDDHWIYMSSTVKKVAFLAPKEVDRQILALSFSNEKIDNIEKLTLDDANNIAINPNETSATPRELGFFRKYFGGVGSYMPFGNNQNDKGI